MEYQDHIARVLAYIEANLTAELPLAALARVAGYSEYHFLRVFKEVCRLTPADYIRKRRLSEIAREAADSGRPISSIAFAYGFNSKENFTRAFKTEHCVSPTAYRTAGNSLKLYPPICLEAPPLALEPVIRTLEGFELTAYPCGEEYPPSFWNQSNCEKRSLRLSGGKPCEDYGVCLWNEDRGRLDYWIGIRSEDAAGETDGTVSLTVPGGTYAEFTTPAATHFDFVDTIHRTWDAIHSVWLPDSGYVYTGGYQCEHYLEQSRTFRETILVPIERRKPG